MSHRDPVKRKETNSKYYEKNKEKVKGYNKIYNTVNKEKNTDQMKKYRELVTQNAYESIRLQDKNKWIMWCNRIKRCAKQNKHPYSEEFTNEIIFEKMILGCFYCGDIATSIDRLDSTLDHTPDNCIASCLGCNMSKGAADPSTFIRKAYFRAHEKYYDDDTDIWFVNKKKPALWQYKKRAENKEVPFDLTKSDFETLIKEDCAYCKRTPTTWFGIDRVIPLDGYVIGNVTTCCFDCNIDKHVTNVDAMIKRNKMIAERVNTGELVVRNYIQTNLHIGIQNTSKKVYAYGNVYESKIEASRSLGKADAYVTHCIQRGTHSKYIFEIHDDFQSDVK